MKIYTRTGDGGETGLQGGARVSKAGRRISAYGAVDEANSVLGLMLAEAEPAAYGDIIEVVRRVQSDLFVVGADLSNPGDGGANRVSQGMVDSLEADIDRFEAELPPLSNFILPGGSILAAHAHHARTVTRRAEVQTVLLCQDEQVNQTCTAYLNRLSDLLFVIGRLANKRGSHDDTVWKP